MAQPGWNWPEDEELKSQAKEKQAYYRIQIQLDDHNATFNTLNWLYNNSANLNPSIYIDGVKIIETMIKGESDTERIAGLQDSLLWMYDQRIKHFGEEAKITDRKAYDAFKMFYRSKTKYPLLTELYAKAFELNGNDISEFNLITYMTLAKFYYEAAPNEMTAEMVLDIHSKVSSAITYKIENGGRVEKLKTDQDKADAFLSSLKGILSCEFIEKNLVPKLKSEPDNLNNAKKVFSYSLKAKCSSQPYFTEAAAIVYENDPTYNLAKALGEKYMASGEFEKAIDFYTKGAELAKMDEEKYESFLGIASAYSKIGDRVNARSFAYRAGALSPSAKAPYNMIGNMYYSSYSDCKKDESIVLDRAIFIAAFDMYEKAGNQSQMQACKEQFPSIEEIFKENYEEGQQVELGCWINTSVKLARRD